MSFEELKERQAGIWSSAPFERIAETAAEAHDDLVARLGAGPGMRWLDLACGTGAIAFRAARLGAEVTGLDLAPGLIETAKRLAAEEGLDVRLDIGDCERLAYPDASFDVVSSSYGVMFAPDHGAVARELARVCRPGGRLGLACWRPDGGVGDLFRVMRPFMPPPVPGLGDPFDWGREEHATALLGAAFELQFVERDSRLRASSGEAVWELFSSSFGPTKTLADSLDPARREELRRAFVAYYEESRAGDGIDNSRTYLVTLGRRR